MHRFRALVIGLAAVLLCLRPGGADASETVLGGGFAQACHDAAILAATKRVVDERSTVECNLALGIQPLSPHDRAATYVNRGILLLSRAAYDASLRDFRQAIEIRPDLGGAYANLGAALIASGHLEEGIAGIDRALALNTPEPEKAYFNRAVARERLGDVRGAYADFSQAAAIKPSWEEPRKELARFHLTVLG